MKQKNISYSTVGDNYDTKDPIKKLAQSYGLKTAANLEKQGFLEVKDSRGESAFVWKQNDIFMAFTIEGLGTKNLIADETRKITGKTYYDAVGHDTVATVINDLITVGAKPLVLNAYWAIEDNYWLKDTRRMRDLIKGFKNACNIAGVTWGGGETATIKQIMKPNTAEFAGSAVGIIPSKKRLITQKNLKPGDRILLLKSNGINANGISLARTVAKKLYKGYGEKLSSGKLYGEALMTKTNIYAGLIQDLLDKRINIHYISNITGHGLRKIMRSKKDFTYVIDKIFEPQEIFLFIQKHTNLQEREMYATFNMGMDYAIFLSKTDIKKAQKIIAENKFESIDAGYVENGKRQVIIKPKNIVFKSSTLDLR